MPLDPSRVRSGFDVEIGLGPRYLQYLLLLALDVGVVPASFPYDEPDHPERGPIQARLMIPPDVDRTYTVDPAADLPLEENAEGFDVAILFDDESGADLKVTVKAHLTRAADHIDVVGTFVLFVRLTLQKTPAASGPGLAAVGLGVELVRVEGAQLARLKSKVDRTLSLDGLAAGGRVEDIALRKFPAEGAVPASLTLYLNLLLRSGPQEGAFLSPRGDVLLSRNILPPEADLAFATRKDIYGALAADAFFRRAVPSGSGFAFPLHFKSVDATLINISVAPTTKREGPNRLRLKMKAEIDAPSDPAVTLLVDLLGGIDDEGVMTWKALAEAYENNLLLQLIFAGIAAAFIPLVGLGGALYILTWLDLARLSAEGLISSSVIGTRAQDRLDATLLDIAPNRLTFFRRRWDPLYETHHQIGLRAGDTRIDADGIALWGRAVLTRAPQPVADTVIRDTAHVGDEAPTALRYRVSDIDPLQNLLGAHVPATDRRAFTQHDPIGQPTLFQLAVDEAIERIGVDRVLGQIPYLVERVDFRGGKIEKLLVISQRESDEQRNRLIDAQVATVTPIIAEHEPQVRAQVLADFAASGVIPTPQELEAAVAAGLQKLIDEAVQAYIDGDLGDDLEAALEPLLRLELAPTHFGKLQSDGILTIPDFELIFVEGRSAFYYRDHYFRKIETTRAKRLADNLVQKPRYRSTPQGPVFIPQKQVR